MQWTGGDGSEPGGGVDSNDAHVTLDPYMHIGLHFIQTVADITWSFIYLTRWTTSHYISLSL